MKFSVLLSAAVTATFFSHTSAAACTNSNGNPNPPTWAITGANKIIQAVTAYTNPDAALAAAAAEASIRAYAASLLVNSIKVKRQAGTFECKSTETCYTFFNYPWCINTATHAARDDNNVTWNLDNGDYTLADGKKGNVYTNYTPYSVFIASSYALTNTASAGTAKTTPATNTKTAATGAVAGTPASAGLGTTPAPTAAGSGGSGSAAGLNAKGGAGEMMVGGWEVVAGAVGAALVAAL